MFPKHGSPGFPWIQQLVPLPQAEACHCVSGSSLLIYTGLGGRRGGDHGSLACFKAGEGNAHWGKVWLHPTQNPWLMLGIQFMVRLAAQRGGELGFFRSLVPSAWRGPCWVLTTAPFHPKSSIHTHVPTNKLTLNGCRSRRSCFQLSIMY